MKLMRVCVLYLCAEVCVVSVHERGKKGMEGEGEKGMEWEEEVEGEKGMEGVKGKAQRDVGPYQDYYMDYLHGNISWYSLQANI